MSRTDLVDGIVKNEFDLNKYGGTQGIGRRAHLSVVYYLSYEYMYVK